MSLISRFFHKKATPLDHPQKFSEFLAANHYGAAFWHAAQILNPGDREFALAKAHFVFLCRKDMGSSFLHNDWLWPGVPSAPSQSDAEKHILEAQKHNIPGSFALGVSILCLNRSTQDILENEETRNILEQAALRDGSPQARASLMVYHSIRKDFDAVFRYYDAGDACGEVEAVMIRLALTGCPIRKSLSDHIRGAVEFGHPEGHLFYGRQLIQAGDFFHGETELRTAMRLGHPEAGALLADVLSQTTEGRERLQDINELYRNSASLGHKGAQAMLAIRTILNQVPGGDKEKALKELKTLAIDGEATSARFLKEARL